MTEDSEPRNTVTVGRYLLHRQIARGGMATIHIARLMGDEGFSRIVAAKRLLPELAADTEFVAMFMDEARIASRVHHPNVVPVLDLVTTSDEVMLVQDYVHGVPLHILLRTADEKNQKIPVRIAVSIAAQVLAGLHAAHTTLDEMGAPLAIVHRDVSPQNVMIASDGSARLLDLGVAKAPIGAHDGRCKGKLAYSAPEQVRGTPVPQSDIYALSVVLWELLVGHRMHGTPDGDAELVATIMAGAMPTITDALSNEADWGAIDADEWKLLSALDPIVSKGLAVEVDKRYQTASEMAVELTQAVSPASSSEVGVWVKTLGKDFIAGRDKIIAAEEASWRRSLATNTQPRRLLTPVPGELAPPSIEVIAPLRAARPPARGNTMIVAVLGTLVVLLGIGVVFAMKSSVEPVPAAPPMPEATVEPPTPVSEPTTTAAAEPPPAEKPPTRRPARSASRPAVVELDKPKAPPASPIDEAIPEAAPAAAEKPEDDCNPPYYFQGPKKVFKPNCI